MDRAVAHQLLRHMDRAGIPFALIGSVAVELLEARALLEPPADIDILVPPRALDQLFRHLADQGFSWWSWQEPLPLPAPAALLEGRWYARAKRADGLVLDATYECVALPLEDVIRQRFWYAGIPVALPRYFLGLMAARGERRDQAKIQAWGKALAGEGQPLPRPAHTGAGQGDQVMARPRYPT